MLFNKAEPGKTQAGRLRPQEETRLAAAMQRDLRPVGKAIAAALKKRDWGALRKKLGGMLPECGTESADVLEEAVREDGEEGLGSLEALGPLGGGEEAVANSECRAKDPAHCPTHGTPEGREEKHTPEEKKRIAEYKAAVDHNVVDFVKRCAGIEDGDELSKQRCTICDATPEFVARTKELTGIDTTGWKIELRGERVRHLDIRHGRSGKQDQSLADIDDIGRIGYVLQHFDSMEILRNEKGQPVFSGQYQSRGMKPTPVLVVRMKIDGTFAVQEAVPDSKWRKIYVVSARIEKTKEP